MSDIAPPAKPIEIIINKAEIAHTAVKPEQFPVDDFPEFAFVGKSNVGKSSLINAMLGRKRLVRTSGQPGKTRTINFFAVEEKMYFVDLPGYGYARVSKSESAKWGAMIESYLKNRPQIKHIFLLLDIRHEPGANDIMLYEWFLHYSLPFTLVATKSDKLKRSQVQKHLAIIRRALNASEPPIPFSSETKDGRNSLWTLILDKCTTNML